MDSPSTRGEYFFLVDHRFGDVGVASVSFGGGAYFASYKGDDFFAHLFAGG